MVMAPMTLMLDFDGVVMFDMHHDPRYRRDWSIDIEADLGLRRDDVQRVVFQNPAYRAVQMGQVDILDFLDQVLPTIGFQQGAQAFIDYWIPRTSQMKNLNHDLLADIQILRQDHHIKVYVPTVQNRFRRTQLHDVMKVDQYFDGFFYASDIGFFKDDPQFYQAIAHQLGLDPGQDRLLFFDDRPHFVGAASAALWSATVYNTLDDFRAHPWIQPLLPHRRADAYAT